MSNLYLIGMMGSGKSMTGRKLAPLLGCRFFDLDQMLEERLRQTIAETFKSKGEDFFRREETALLQEVSRQDRSVIATGGGIILKPENISCMRQTGKVLYLEASLEVLWTRVKDRNERPLLHDNQPKEKLAAILKARKAIYESSCDGRFQTDGKTPAEVAKEIAAIWKEKL